MGAVTGDTGAVTQQKGRELWENHRMAVEYAAGAALAGVRAASAYVPSPGEKVAVILCGANTDVADLAAGRP